MTNLAIYIRLIIYPLLALGLFLLGTCCRTRRIERTIYFLWALMSMLQLTKTFQQITTPSVPYPWAEWLLGVISILACLCVWLDFWKMRRGTNHF